MGNKQMGWSSFYNEVKKQIKYMYKDLCIAPFFRGQGDSSWDLIPSLYRIEDIDHQVYEKILLNDFATNSANLGTYNKSDWEILFEMRHFGLPTRLLDWTESFSVALYFALRDNLPNPCLWILDPYKLNNFSIGQEVIMVVDALKVDYSSFIEKPTFVNPVSLFPVKSNYRVFAQKGAFTIHGSSQDPLNKICPDCIKKIEIPTKAISGAKDFLMMAGVNEFTVYPDMDGLARHLKKRLAVIFEIEE